MRLKGVRVLIVEDEPFVRLDLSDTLEDNGFQVAGEAARVEAALHLVEDVSFDIALLDVNLGGERIDSVVAAVERHGKPFILLTGYGSGVLEHRPDAIVVEKPYDRPRLIEAMQQAMKGTA